MPLVALLSLPEGVILCQERQPTRARISFVGGKTRIACIALSPDKRLLAVARYDKTIEVWDIAGREIVRSLRGPAKGLSAVAFDEDGRYLASANWDGTVTVWDCGTGKKRITFRGHVRETSTVAFQPDGNLLASGGWDQTARVWNTTTRQPAFTFRGHAEKPDPENGLVLGTCVTSVAFSPDGRQVASSSSFPGRRWKYGCVKVWETATGKEMVSLDEAADQVVFDPTGKRLAMVNWDGLTVRDSATGKAISAFVTCDGDVVSVSFSPTGRCLAAVSNGSTVKVCDTATKQELLAVPGGDDRIVLLSRDGTILASSPDGVRLDIWDIALTELRP
jgi:DNA-binding beta-propeller fold protein YncE